MPVAGNRPKRRPAFFSHDVNPKTQSSFEFGTAKLGCKAEKTRRAVRLKKSARISATIQTQHRVTWQYYLDAKNLRGSIRVVEAKVSHGNECNGVK